MGWIYTLRKWLFPRQGNNPLQKKVLHRHEAFAESYRKWSKGERKEQLLLKLSNAYELVHLGVSAELPVHAFTDSQGTSLLIHYIESYGREQFTYLFEHFKERSVKLGYTVALSDRRILERDDFEECIDRYQLKPAFQIFSLSERASQLYGMISIHLHSVNDRPIFIRLSALPLKDEMFLKPLPFDELMAFVLH